MCCHVCMYTSITCKFVKVKDSCRKFVLAARYTLQPSCGVATSTAIATAACTKKL